MPKLFPVLLCGGSGTRLWPLSRKTHPKQFSNILGNYSLLQASAKLLNGNIYSEPIVITRDSLRFLTRDQLAAVNVNSLAILIEPEGRNTAPAILAAALWLEKTQPDALLLVSPTDHVIPDSDGFGNAVKRAEQAAVDGQIVTFGIVPTHAETGYGWLELPTPDALNADAPAPLTRFVEKPNLENAARMLASGNFLWNAGIFLMSVKTAIAAYQKYAPDLIETVRQSVDQAVPDLEFTRLGAAPWNATRDISIDFAIMEHADNLCVMPYRGTWSDLGSWEAVQQNSETDPDGNVTTGAAVAMDCQNTMLRAESPNQALVGIGLENIIAVAMPDAVLVAKVGAGQGVKEAVALLKMQGVKQASDFPVDHRPWGSFESLATGARFQVKRIVVKPGGALSLQSHHHRSEHWIIVAGTAKVTLGDQVKLLTENESVYVPLGVKHRLENPGMVPMVLIEVQTGSYLGEDDIIRFDDIYARR